MTTETEIANLALQKCGADAIASGALWSEDSKNALEIRKCYHHLRRSELRRNVWRFSIRTEILRPRNDDTRLIVFPTWDALVAYAINNVVVRSDGQLWMAISTGINHDPDARTFTYWTNYTGTDWVTLYDVLVSFMSGEIVYETGTNKIFMSVQNNNVGELLTDTDWWLPLDAAAYSGATTYALGDRVLSAGITYVSIQAANTGHTPASSPTWWTVTGAPAIFETAFIYPIGAGPSSSTATRNVFRLPNNFMREAPQAPKQGSYLPLGAPAGLPYSDWQFEGNYFTSQMAGPIAFRFAADISDPNAMDPMFIDGFSNRVGFTVVETLTQSDTKKKILAGEYNKFMSEARTVNGIETGAVEPPEDSYISLRY